MNGVSDTHPRGPKGPADPEREDAIVAMVQGGKSYRKVGREFGISGARVGQIMNRARRLGIEPPPSLPVTTWPTGHPSVKEMDEFLARQEARRGQGPPE